MNSLHLETAKKHGVSIAIVVVCLFILLCGNDLPAEMMDWANTSMGRVVMIFAVGATFATAHPIAGVLAIIVFWNLSLSAPVSMQQKPSKTVHFEPEQQEPQQADTNAQTESAMDMPLYNNTDAAVSADINGTLEEEVIVNMAPLKQSMNGPSIGAYVPVLDTSITATEIGEA